MNTFVAGSYASCPLYETATLSIPVPSSLILTSTLDADVVLLLTPISASPLVTLITGLTLSIFEISC